MNSGSPTIYPPVVVQFEMDWKTVPCRWDDCGMSKQPYTPQVGDTVIAVGQNGSFRVIKIDESKHAADLELLGTSRSFNLKGVPWGALSPVKPKREDVNQAAARIVREATERD